MSSFRYGKHTDTHIGIWLRHGSNEDVINMIKKSGNKRFFDTVERVVISEYESKTNMVWLEVWCKSVIDSIRDKNRYNVFHIKTNVNEDWICEGDLGSGVNFFK